MEVKGLKQWYFSILILCFKHDTNTRRFRQREEKGAADGFMIARLLALVLVLEGQKMPPINLCMASIQSFFCSGKTLPTLKSNNRTLK